MLLNITPVPNEVFDLHLKKLKVAEIGVLLVVIRQTLGWKDKKTGTERKENDWISTSQLIEKTGNSSRAITSAIEVLIKNKLIEIRDKDGNILDSSEKRKRKQRLYYRLHPSIIFTAENDVEKAGDNNPSKAENDEAFSKNENNLQQNMLTTKEISQKKFSQNSGISTNKNQIQYNCKNYPYSMEQFICFANEIESAGGIDALMVSKKALIINSGNTIINTYTDIDKYKNNFLIGIYEPLREIYKTEVPYVFWNCMYDAMQKAKPPLTK